MKLYYAKGACSLSPHIALLEAGLGFETERVDLKTKKTESGKDYNAFSEKGYVPMLVLDNGEQLSEGPAIVQYIADQKPEAGLAPANGTIERTHLQEWLNYISTELHKGFSPLFSAEAIGPQAEAFFRAKLEKRFDYLATKLEGKQYLTGNSFTIADCYLFTVLNWSKGMKFDLGQWPALQAYQERVAARPKVQQAMQAEGMIAAKAA